MNYDSKLCSHYLNLQFSKNFLSDCDKKLNIQLPYPIHKPLKISNSDPIDKVNKDLENYNKELATLSKDFHLVKNQVLNQSFTNSHGTVTKRILNICNKDKPGIPFICDYNPYYTGFLNYLTINGKEYLVRPDSKNNLRLTNLDKPWKNKKLQTTRNFEEPITSISSHKNNLLVKHKKETNLLKVVDVKSDASCIYHKKFKHEILDIKFKENHLGLVLSDTKFRLYDIETDKKIKFENNSVINCNFINNNLISLLSQQKLITLDLRSCDELIFSPNLENCDYFSCFQINDNLLYLATRHNLIRTDLRFLKQEEFCSHMMRSTPCYLEFLDNYLCLSSQKEDKVLFCGNPISSLPIEIPNISVTLTNCKLKKDVLLKNQLDNYLQVSIGGIKLISTNHRFLYSVNAFGEIFKQKLGDCCDFDDVNAIEALYSWIGYLTEISKPLYLTNIANVSDARFALNRCVDNRKLDKFTKKNKKLQFFMNHFKNRYHKDNLGELATNFVAIWDDEDEEGLREQVDLVPEVAPIDKVSDWIESQYFF